MIAGHVKQALVSISNGTDGNCKYCPTVLLIKPKTAHNGQFTIEPCQKQHVFKASQSHYAFKIRGISDITGAARRPVTVFKVKSTPTYSVNISLQYISGVILSSNLIYCFGELTSLI